MKLALGTVQFGLDYGISNIKGQVESEEIDDILTLAKANHIDTLDCARAYGTSEENLGQLDKSQAFKIVTKIPSLSHSDTSIIPYFNRSLNYLKREKIDTLLFHDANSLLKHPLVDSFCDEICQLKKQGLVSRIGISVYTPEQIHHANEKLPLNIVQAPFNILDQRLDTPKNIHLLSKNGIKIHTRSAFLQGLLLMSEGQWPSYFSPYIKLLKNITAQAQRLKVSKLTLALAFLVRNSHLFPHIEKIVVGCCSVEQLEEIISSYHNAKDLDSGDIKWRDFACNDISLIDPSNWKTE